MEIPTFLLKSRHADSKVHMEKQTRGTAENSENSNEGELVLLYIKREYVTQWLATDKPIEK